MHFRPLILALAAADSDNETPTRPPNLGLDTRGCPVLPPGVHGALGHTGPKHGTSFRRYSIAEFIDHLAMMLAIEDGSHLGRQALIAHVVDHTGLTGKFDFQIPYTMDPHRFPQLAQFAAMQSPGTAGEPAGPGISAVIEKELGLKLEKSKARLDVFIIDRVNPQPTAN